MFIELKDCPSWMFRVVKRLIVRKLKEEDVCEEMMGCWVYVGREGLMSGRYRFMIVIIIWSEIRRSSMLCRWRAGGAGIMLNKSLKSLWNCN